MKNEITQENPESGKIQNLLEQVHGILHQTRNSHYAEDGRADEILEKIILLRTKQEAFQKIFDAINDVVASMMGLDFSKRLSIPPFVRDKNNIFHYFLSALNALNEELEVQSVSKNITQDIITHLSGATPMVVTDKNGLIFFSSTRMESIYGLRKNELQGKPVQLLFENYEAIHKKITGKEHVKDMDIKLSKWGRNESAIPGLLTISLSKEKGQVKGIIYSIKEKLQEPEVAPVLSLKQGKEIEELEKLVREYRTLWKMWIDQSTLLSTEEVLSLEYYLNCRSHKGLALELKQPEEQIQRTYQKATQKLNDSLQNYNAWIINKARELKKNDEEEKSGKWPDLPCEDISTKPLQETEELLKEYSALWKTWINQNALLTAKEELAIDYYLNYYSHEVLARQLDLPAGGIQDMYEKAVQKLRFALQRYHSWIVARAIDLKREDSKTKNTDQVKFLKTPLREFNLPIQMLRILHSADIETPEDIINRIGSKGLSRLRGIGPKYLKSILELFEKHNCKKLLRKK